MPDAYQVTLTTGALADLDRLDSFLREKNPAAADRMLAAITAALGHLATSPFTGPNSPPLPCAPSLCGSARAATFAFMRCAGRWSWSPGCFMGARIGEAARIEIDRSGWMGTERVRQFGKVEIPQEAFISALKMDW